MSVEEFLKKILGDANEGTRVNEVTETDKTYAAFLSDVYGNAFDEPPICVYKDTLEECSAEDCVVAETGDGVEIPSKYASYKVLVKKYLIEEYAGKDKDVNRLVRTVVNALYYARGYINFDLNQLYTVCSYMVSYAHLVCSEKEKYNFMEIQMNEPMREIFGMSDEELLDYCRGFQYKPECMKKMEGISELILNQAFDKYLTGCEIDKNELEVQYELFKNLLAEGREILEEGGELLDIEALTDFLDYFEEQTKMEYEYAMDLWSDISYRMLDILESGKEEPAEGGFETAEDWGQHTLESGKKWESLPLKGRLYGWWCYKRFGKKGFTPRKKFSGRRKRFSKKGRQK